MSKKCRAINVSLDEVLLPKLTGNLREANFGSVLFVKVSFLLTFFFCVHQGCGIDSNPSGMRVSSIFSTQSQDEITVCQSTDVETINAMMWSNKLDEIFAENLKRDPTIYQYFASKEGVLRYFPAHRQNASHIFSELKKSRGTRMII